MIIKILKLLLYSNFIIYILYYILMNRNNYKLYHNKNYKKICNNNQNNISNNISNNNSNKLNINTINNNGYYYDKIRNIHYNNQCFWISIIDYLNNFMNININLTELLNIAKKNNSPINDINEMVTLIDGIKYPYIDAITNVTIEFNLTIHIHYNYYDSNKLIQLLEITSILFKSFWKIIRVHVPICYSYSALLCFTTAICVLLILLMHGTLFIACWIIRLKKYFTKDY